MAELEKIANQGQDPKKESGHGHGCLWGRGQKNDPSGAATWKTRRGTE